MDRAVSEGRKFAPDHPRLADAIGFMKIGFMKKRKLGEVPSFVKVWRARRDSNRQPLVLRFVQQRCTAHGSTVVRGKFTTPAFAIGTDGRSPETAVEHYKPEAGDLCRAELEKGVSPFVRGTRRCLLRSGAWRRLPSHSPLMLSSR